MAVQIPLLENCMAVELTHCDVDALLLIYSGCERIDACQAGRLVLLGYLVDHAFGWELALPSTTVHTPGGTTRLYMTCSALRLLQDSRGDR